MLKLSNIFVFHLILSICASCTLSPSPETTKKNSIPLTYATNLKVDSVGDAIQISIGEKNKLNWSFILSKQKPAELPEHTVWIKIPVNRFLTLSGTDIGMLCKLKQPNAIIGVADKETVFSNTLKKNIALGRAKSFGTFDDIPAEQILALRPQVVTFSCFGKNYPHANELKKAGIICIPILDWKENHPLGKAEWIKLYGYLTGQYKKSEEIFEYTRRTYLDLAEQSKHLRNNPTVFCGSPMGDIWFCPAGESYEAQLIRDAGGAYTYSTTKGTGSLSLNPEKVYLENKTTRFWINPGSPNRKLLESNYSKSTFFTALKNERTYCYSSNRNKYWENSACEPHKILSDLIQIFHGQNQNPMYFYHLIR